MPKYASNWEAEYARYLDGRKHLGEIVSYCHEPLRFNLAPATSYTPDFIVVSSSGRIEIHEVKGYLRDDAGVKFKIAAAQFPYFVFVMLRKKKGVWEEMRRLNDDTAISPGNVPVDVVVVPKPDKLPATMSYKQMLAHPEYSAILSMKKDQLANLRYKLGHLPDEMSELLGLPHADSWAKLESGETKLYHFRNVHALKLLMEER